MSRHQYKNRPRESPASRNRRIFGTTVLNLPLTSTFLVTKIKPQPTPSINVAEGIKCATPMTMENVVNRASGTASGMQHITRAGCLGNGHSAENERWFPVVIGGASGSLSWLPQDPVTGPHSNKRPNQLKVFPKP